MNKALETLSEQGMVDAIRVHIAYLELAELAIKKQVGNDADTFGELAQISETMQILYSAIEKELRADEAGILFS